MGEYSDTVVVLGVIGIQDVIDEFKKNEVPYFKNQNGENEVDESRVMNAINSAENHIAGYLRRVGIDTFDLIPRTKVELRIHVLNLTRYYMGSSTGITTEDIKERYNESIGFLKDIANGKAVLNTKLSKRASFSNVRIG